MMVKRIEGNEETQFECEREVPITATQEMPGNDTDDLFFEFRNSASSTTGASASALDEVSALMAMPTIHTNTLHF